MMDQIGPERGWPPMTRHAFDAGLGLRGANFAGCPVQVAEKIVHQHGIFGHQRFLIQFSVGTLLYGTEVAPLVRRELDGVGSEPTPGTEPALGAP